ncbi:MAG: DUF1015 domain-containing protein [Lachnospiraceae bacterium]|nr:DUF1015 domain-containing protein [Lachnospiraceae bacterium]
MHAFSEMGLRIPRIQLPKEGTDYEKWAVVACDQYTSEPAYWEEADRIVGTSPSTLRMILPEYYLGKPQEEELTRQIRSHMKQYEETGVLRTLPEGCMLVKRTAAGRTRLGLVIAVDLEAYDYTKGSTSLIRATERTITERIPPRLRIRRGAPVELPHIIILIDDPEKTVIEPLAKKKGTVAYDTDLMLDGGHITGTFFPKEKLGGVQEAFSRLYDKSTERFGKGKEFLMAMGDGNHSLATAKAAWEEIKQTLTPQELENHPARYALCELENVHDDGIVFEPIHRVLFGEGKLTGEEIVRKTVEILKKQNPDAYLAEESDEAGAAGREGAQCTPRTDCYRIPVIFGGTRRMLVIDHPVSGLEVGALQTALDELVRTKGVRIDYIHGEQTVSELASLEENAGFLLPSMDKHRLFPAVAADGALPRKTFSMGHANEKRYYLEGRSLRV